MAPRKNNTLTEAEPTEKAPERLDVKNRVPVSVAVFARRGSSIIESMIGDKDNYDVAVKLDHVVEQALDSLSRTPCSPGEAQRQIGRITSFLLSCNAGYIERGANVLTFEEIERHTETFRAYLEALTSTRAPGQEYHWDNPYAQPRLLSGFRFALLANYLYSGEVSAVPLAELAEIYYIATNILDVTGGIELGAKSGGADSAYENVASWVAEYTLDNSYVPAALELLGKLQNIYGTTHWIRSAQLTAGFVGMMGYLTLTEQTSAGVRGVDGVGK